MTDIEQLRVARPFVKAAIALIVYLRFGEKRNPNGPRLHGGEYDDPEFYYVPPAGEMTVDKAHEVADQFLTRLEDDLGRG